MLSKAGLLDRMNTSPSKKGTGFAQPLHAHQHWHVDVAYLNLGGTFYYLCSVLDGASRAIVHWEIREAMTETEVECILQRARELHPGVQPRVITDNGPQFIAKDFKEFIRLTRMTHVRTSPYYPQSNGKVERYHRTIKADTIRPGQPNTVEQARALVTRWVAHYNTVRLHSALGYITPHDFLQGRSKAIHEARDRNSSTPGSSEPRSEPRPIRPQREPSHSALSVFLSPYNCHVHAEPIQARADAPLRREP